MSNMHNLYEQFGVSPWLDNLSRDLIVGGSLQTLIDQGIRGVTSNPSIFEKAFSEGEAYRQPYAELREKGVSTEDAYWQLAIEDIQHACDHLRRVYDESAGNDGFVSLEVSPALARDSLGTFTQAKELWERVSRPNLMIKIPATEQCLPAITETLAYGINVNVTLIFSLHRYLQVIAAYLSGIERLDDPSRVRSVASFFVSRVDSEVDERLSDDSLKGLAAVAQARAAYGIFLESFTENSERWQRLVRQGAVAQRPLWASTSTKNPAYPDLKYVEGLLAHGSVNTLPNSTIDAIIDHASLASWTAIDAGQIEQAHEDLQKLASAGINMNDVAAKLEQEGVAKFQAAFSSMLAALEA